MTKQTDPLATQRAAITQAQEAVTTAQANLERIRERRDRALIVEADEDVVARLENAVTQAERDRDDAVRTLAAALAGYVKELRALQAPGSAAAAEEYRQAQAAVAAAKARHAEARRKAFQRANVSAVVDDVERALERDPLTAPRLVDRVLGLHIA